MVGKGAGMKFVRRMKKYHNKPFRPDGVDDTGYGCYGLVYAYCRDIGKPIPDSYGDWTIQNYFSRFQEDPRAAEDVLVTVFESIGTEVNISDLLAGDLIIVKIEDGLFPAIYCGNGKFMASYLDVGVRVFEIDSTKMAVAMARRV
jgi:cell wall-associated NlpC family hydrolase